MKQSRQPAVLIFGEDDNDRKAIAELLRAVHPNAPKIESRRKPLILMKGRAASAAKHNADAVAKVIKADAVRFNVQLVLAHQDCDAVEPAHIDLSERIEKNLATVSPRVIAVTPAFEMETWWWLWPDAIIRVNNKWRRPNRKNKEVGLIPNAKETLIKDLRPKGDHTTPDYKESDAPLIAAKVRELNIIGKPEAKSASFKRFYTSLKDIDFGKLR